VFVVYPCNVVSNLCFKCWPRHPLRHSFDSATTIISALTRILQNTMNRGRYFKALSFGLLMWRSCYCRAQLATLPPAIGGLGEYYDKTASPSWYGIGGSGGGSTTCSSQTDEFYACLSSDATTTDTLVDYVACGKCLGANVDYSPSTLDVTTASCDAIGRFVQNELRDSTDTCFPSYNPCTEQYFAMEECYVTESLVGSRCGQQDSDLSDNDGTVRNDGEMEGSNANGRDDGNSGGFIRGSRDNTSNAMERPLTLMPVIAMVLVGISV
jgi:hypothetical protein